MLPRLIDCGVAGFLEITECRVRFLHSQNRINVYKDGLNVQCSKENHKKDSNSRQSYEYIL